MTAAKSFICEHLFYEIHSLNHLKKANELRHEITELLIGEIEDRENLDLSQFINVSFLILTGKIKHFPPNITVLYLYSWYLEDINYINNFPLSIEHLIFRFGKVSIRESIKFPVSLVGLSFEFCSLYDDILQYVPQNLKFIDIYYCNIPANMFKLLPLGLEELVIERCKMLNECLKYIPKQVLIKQRNNVCS